MLSLSTQQHVSPNCWPTPKINGQSHDSVRCIVVILYGKREWLPLDNDFLESEWEVSWPCKLWLVGAKYCWIDNYWPGTSSSEWNIYIECHACERIASARTGLQEDSALQFSNSLNPTWSLSWILIIQFSCNAVKFQQHILGPTFDATFQWLHPINVQSIITKKGVFSALYLPEASVFRALRRVVKRSTIHTLRFLLWLIVRNAHLD
jgi:hypothetical protein